jgi:hypothetical protein
MWPAVAFKVWLAHLRGLTWISVILGVIALLIAALLIVVMLKTRDFAAAGVFGGLLFLALGVTIFLPSGVAKYSIGVILILFGIRAIVTGKTMGLGAYAGTASEISRETQPVYYWISTLSLFFFAVVWLYVVRRQQPSHATVPPNSTVERDARKSGARPSP